MKGTLRSIRDCVCCLCDPWLPVGHEIFCCTLLKLARFWYLVLAQTSFLSGPKALVRVEGGEECSCYLPFISYIAGPIWVKLSGIMENSAQNVLVKEFVKKIER